MIYIIILGASSGLCEGAGVLPDGPLNASLGGTVMFTTTLTPTEEPFTTVIWQSGAKQIIVYTPASSSIPPEYEGRLTFFPSTASLELRALTFADTGHYHVDILPGFLSGRTRLDVYEPVSSVTVTPQSSDVVEFNSSVRLSCSSSGSFPSFLWMNGSCQVTASDRVHLTDGGSSLTIVNVSRYDQESYTCHVFNPVSNGISGPANILVSFGPENIILTVSPSQNHFKEGSSINLTCSAESRPPVLQFFWFLNRDQLRDTGPELRLMNIQTTQSGNYSCQAFHSNTLRYVTSQPLSISVLQKISEASLKPSTDLIFEGTTVNLTCHASGSIFTRQWMKDGLDLILDESVTLSDDKGVLSFNTVNKENTGEYLCNISNPVSSSVTKYSMIVNYGPENVKIEGKSNINVNQAIQLKCSAGSIPPATFTWMLNGMAILDDSTEFSKEKAGLSDSGNYTCVALNNLTERNVSVMFELLVQEEFIINPIIPSTSGSTALEKELEDH
ncbi:cell adhesion molecule CEACAM5-like [Xenentodon cancila]